MKAINFTSGGKLGDFIHSLYVVKNLCEQRGAKANLYAAEGGDVWPFGLERAFKDLYQIVSSQPYINQFNLLPNNFNEPLINLNDWRPIVGEIHHRVGRYTKGWSDILAEVYKFDIPKDYAWMQTNNADPYAVGKIIIHRSTRRHNPYFKWESILNNIHEEILFITSNQDEWDRFPYKITKIKPYMVETTTQLALAIKSCRFFIGNQSAPFAIANAFDVPRLGELDADPAIFYKEETKYSSNISWFLSDSEQCIRPPCPRIL